MKKICLVVLFSLFYGVAVAADSNENKPRDWLLNAEDDTARFKLLQQNLRGFDQPMWEVGERYRSIYDALVRNNYELANYHWDKIRITIKNGYLKRPARQANADGIFLDSTWDDVNQSFQSKNSEQAWDGFELAKATCMVCHGAESVEFINNQPLFELATPEE